MKSTLTTLEKQIARSMGVSSAVFAAQKAKPLLATHSESMIDRMLGRRSSSPAIGAKSEARSPSVALLRAHQEVDRAHKNLYENAGSGDAWANAPDRALLNTAITELKAFNPADDSTYDRLLNGVLHAMCLLGRVAPAFANIEG